MRLLPLRPFSQIAACLLLSLAAVVPSSAQEISSSPTSLRFANTYVGKATGSQVLTISKVASGTVNITSIGFDCAGFGISSGVAPFSLTSSQLITHYSIFFEPAAAQTFNCNFVITLKDKTQLKLPLTGKSLSTTATSSVTPASLAFPDQSLGKTSAGQTVTIKNTGATSMKLNAITLSHPNFTVSSVKLPATINKGASLSLQVFYTPSHEASENGAIDFTYDSIPDSGASLTGNGVTASSLAIATNATLPQATKTSAYQATLSTSAGTGPFTWKVASGSSLPSGLSLSSAGVISGTLNSSVGTGTSTFSIQVTDSANKTATTKFTLGIYANLGDNCNDISFNVPSTSTPMVALNDLGTGTYQGSEGGLYPDGSNDRPASHDADGVGIAQGIQPLDSNGNPDASGKEVLLAVGESTAQNEFNYFLPIANADPAKNSSVVLVNGAQGGATPQTFKSSASNYWSTVLNDYLPQSNVTAKQVVAAWIEDTDGIASGTFPTDMTTLQSEYETMMKTMLTLFPNLKLVYFSSRVYGGYSNGVGKPSNPEPFAYEVGFAVKWAIQDQINGKSSLNYDPNKGAVVAPWMSWGPYYWSNGMLGRNDGTVWDCEDFSPDGTHPSGTFGQGKVAKPLLDFLKTDDTTTPWYLAH